MAEHTTRTYSEDAELSTTEEIFGQKGVRRAMNRCFLWQRDPLAMTAMELVGVDASERATVRAIASEEVSMVARGGARAREVPVSDVFGGFPVAHVEASTSLADVAYCLRSIWPDPVDSIAVTAGGRVIAALEAGAAETLAVGDSTAITTIFLDGRPSGHRNECTVALCWHSRRGEKTDGGRRRQDTTVRRAPPKPPTAHT